MESEQRIWLQRVLLTKAHHLREDARALQATAPVEMSEVLHIVVHAYNAIADELRARAVRLER